MSKKPYRWGGYFPNTGVLEIIEMETDRVIQVGSLQDRSGYKFLNKNQYRVYSTDGISPCLYPCCGGGLEPKIVVYETDKGIRNIPNKKQQG